MGLEMQRARKCDLWTLDERPCGARGDRVCTHSRQSRSLGRPSATLGRIVVFAAMMTSSPREGGSERTLDLSSGARLDLTRPE